jgi:thiol-disulfide isomerase/thioredoxin
LRPVIASLLGLVLAPALAGCDRQKAAVPQAEEAAANAAAAARSYPTGRLDRSHAGTSAPEVAFEDPHGRPARIADFRGRPVLVNLWATWCAPCRAEMPALDALQKELGSEKFEVVAVNVDTGDDAKPKKFLADTGVEALGYYRDNTMAAFEELKTRGLALGLPVTLLVDAEGCLLAHMNGPAEWSSDDAKKLIGVALGG